MATDVLFDLIAVHCFAQCGHVVRETTPQAAHDAMEQHYRDCHAALIRILAGDVRP